MEIFSSKNFIFNKNNAKFYNLVKLALINIIYIYNNILNKNYNFGFNTDLFQWWIGNDIFERFMRE